MKLSRRDLLRSGAAVGTAAAAPLIGRSIAEAAVAPSRVRQVATLGSVIRKGAAGAGGYRPLVLEAGEDHVLRTDLGVAAERGRRARRQALLAYAQMSDVHIVDAESPLRVEYLDRFDDPSPVPATGIFTSAYRAHEMLSGQVADAMVRRLNAVATGPVTGQPLALAVQTGDNSDNSQYNEVRWNIDLLDGERVRVDSGDLKKWEGVADSEPTTYDRAYWHPDPPPAGQKDDQPKTKYGFPTVPGLLDAARRPFQSEGLQMPWYSVFGNHDGLAQGNFPHTLQLSAIATGSLKVISPPLGLNPAIFLDDLMADPGGVLGSLTLNPGVRQVTPDPARRLITRAQIVEEHFTTTGAPLGHGFTATNKAAGTAYYAFDQGLCRFVVMDTVNPNGYANGSLDQAQFAWLQGVLDDSADRIVMVFSHHTSGTMDNFLVATGGDLQPRVLGDAVVELLLTRPQVVAWVNGHTHRNAITPHRREGGAGGFWEINTASHIDWPQQSRLIELTDNRDGTLSIFTTMVDHAGPVSYGGDLGDARHLAGLSRELTANDWQHRDDTGLGARQDRNCELVVQAPEALRR